MAIGHYRHHVTLRDPDELPIPDPWWCDVQPMGSQVIDGQAAFMLRGRYHPGITLETQIDLEGRTLQVQAITDVDERHVSMVVSAVEVRGRK